MGNADSQPISPEQPIDAAAKLNKDGTTGATSSGVPQTDEGTSEKREDKPKRSGGRDLRTFPKASDDQVNVNIPMADLMAYLQVVANNSNNLPLTKRDDPELDQPVSSLSSEDYARKSAAFVPSDVRVIGGTFTRYGRVWDLPTSEVRRFL